MPVAISPRMFRWTLLLGAYSYRIHYHKDSNNTHADALRRFPLSRNVDESEPPGDILLMEVEEYHPLQVYDIASMTKASRALSQVKN